MIALSRSPAPQGMPHDCTNLPSQQVTAALVVTSEMPEGGRIFSDGIVERALDWNAGSKVTVTVGDRYIRRVAG
jgi:hypothetical protein